MTETGTQPDLVVVAGAGVVLAVAAVVIAYLKWRNPKGPPSKS